MSLPGLACLYGGLVPKKWAVNTMFMCFTGFSAVLVVWVLWGYKMGFGTPIGGGAKDQVENFTYTGNFFHNFFNNFVGHPETSLNGQLAGLAGEAVRQRRHGISRSPQASSALFYFQFVFAAITPLLFLGSVLGRIKVKVWMIFVPLWTTFVYSVNAMLIWGGGYWAPRGRGRLLRWLRHPPRRRHERVRRGLGDRAATRPRSGAVHSAQLAAGRRSAPASSGWAGTASTAVTRTSRAPTRRPRS